MVASLFGPMAESRVIDQDFDKIILGIDPGTNLLGYGILGIQGKKQVMISLGVIELHKYSSHAMKLKKIFERCLSIIDMYHPDEVALEAPFFGKNVQSMLKLGRAQGVVMAAALYRDLPIFEYAPKRVKQAITGKGSASKEQVAGMVANLLNIKELPKTFDSTDAMAVAFCHYFSSGGPETGTKSYSGWGAFLKDNPDRVKD